jgi:hypothetical protein
LSDYKRNTWKCYKIKIIATKTRILTLPYFLLANIESVSSNYVSAPWNASINYNLCTAWTATHKHHFAFAIFTNVDTLHW